MSRTALNLGLLLFPAPLFAQSVIPIGDADVLGAIARRQALEGRGARARDPECAQSSEEEIVVCAPEVGPSFRVPYQPEPGARVRLAPGEVLPASASIQECHRLCNSQVGITVNVGRLLSDPGGALRDIFRGR